LYNGKLDKLWRLIKIILNVFQVLHRKAAFSATTVPSTTAAATITESTATTANSRQSHHACSLSFEIRGTTAFS
jgi:hypothetical protein